MGGEEGAELERGGAGARGRGGEVWNATQDVWAFRVCRVSTASSSLSSDESVSTVLHDHGVDERR